MLDKLPLVVLLLAGFPLMTQADLVNPSEDDWEAMNCPGALPAEEPPYISRMEHYGNIEEWAKFGQVTAKQYRYTQCVTAIVTRRGHPIAAFNSYQIAVEMGDIESAEQEFSLEAILSKLEQAYSPHGPIYPILRELYEEAYSQKMSDMAKEDSDGARELLTREYLCDCLTQPLEEFDIPGYPDNAVE